MDVRSWNEPSFAFGGDLCCRFSWMDRSISQELFGGQVISGFLPWTRPYLGPKLSSYTVRGTNLGCYVEVRGSL